MELSPVQTPNNADVAAGQAAEAVAADALKVDANFDTFLSLLTAQLRNQDPLEPVKQEDFLAQLAQFSSLVMATMIWIPQILLDIGANRQRESNCHVHHRPLPPLWKSPRWNYAC